MSLNAYFANINYQSKPTAETEGICMKQHLSSVSRRGFLKISAVGSVVAASGSVAKNALSAKTTAWAKGTPVNPNISDLRVVYIKDLSMITRTPPNMDLFSEVNNSVDSAKIKTNMDKMAMCLAQTATADEGWAKIFQKPTGKTWAQCKVYVKVNGRDAKNLAKIAIVSKPCEQLIKLGVLPGNIVIADPSRNIIGSTKYTPFLNNGLPSGVVLRDEAYSPGGDYRHANMIKAFTVTHSRGNYDIWATKALISATNVNVTDIIVNISINKGHIKHYVGGCTMSFKNHIGSTTVCCPSLSDMDRCPGYPWGGFSTSISTGTPEALIAINTHELIMGGGTAAYPTRQQLCISDSLWVGRGGEGDTMPSSNPPGYLAMGTCSPCLDWLLSDKIRLGEMGIQPSNDADAYNNFGSGYDNRLILKRFLDAFGYTSSQPQWIDTSGYVPTDSARPARSMSGERPFSVVCTGKNGAEAAQFHLSESAIRHAGVQVYDLHGELVRDLGHITSAQMSWDGRISTGRMVPAGKYVVKVSYGSTIHSKTLSLIN